MISNQVLQNTIDGMKEISHLDLCVMDADGHEVASTQAVFGEAAAAIPDFAASPADSQAVGPFQFFKVFDEHQLEYILLANFMKNLLLDNLLLIDIYERAKKLHIQANAPRVVMLVETQYGRSRDRDRDALVILQGMIGPGSGDFVTQVDENSVVIIHATESDHADEAVARYADGVLNYLQEDGIQDARVAYGTVVGELKEISHSYKEARMALDVSRIFFEEKDVIAYDQLGIGRLIYQLPLPLCRMFIREIFKDKRPDEFDEETLTTINKFFENNLNVSETSRQLFIHRNTLVYRLDKLLKSTGLDLRIFEDAITFKIALMVVKYMKYMDQENQ